MVEYGEGYLLSGQGTPIVMIPGMEGCKEFWKYQLEGLGGDYRTVACDLARRKPQLSSEMYHYAADVLRIMDTTGIDKAIIVGESFGGMVAQELATSQPERVLALVLCNTMDRPRRGGFGLNMFTLATLAHQLAFMPFLSDEQRKRILIWVGSHRGFVMDPTPGNELLVEYLMDYGTACGLGCYIDRIIAAAKGNYSYKLSAIEAPTLVIRGSEDRLVGTDSAVEFVGRIPGARLALIDGGGHCCSYTLPHATNRAILEWLEETGF